MIWARDLGPTKVSKSSEYFVYWGLFEMNCWGKRSDQIAKGEFLEVPHNYARRKARICFGLEIGVYRTPYGDTVGDGFPVPYSGVWNRTLN